MVGLEPTRLERHLILSQARLPIPSHRHMVGQVGLEPTMLKATGLQPAALPIPLTDPY